MKHSLLWKGEFREVELDDEGVTIAAAVFGSNSEPAHDIRRVKDVLAAYSLYCDEFDEAVLDAIAPVLCSKESSAGGDSLIRRVQAALAVGGLCLAADQLAVLCGRVRCEACNGLGEGPPLSEDSLDAPECSTCNGAGWLEPPRALPSEPVACLHWSRECSRNPRCATVCLDARDAAESNREGGERG